MTPINTEGNDSFKEVKQANFRGAIAGGLASALVGGMLGAVVGELSSGLAGAAVAGLLGAAVGRVKTVKFPTGKQVDIYLNADPTLSKYIHHKVNKGLKVEGDIRFLSNEEFVKVCFEYLAGRMSAVTKLAKLSLNASDHQDEVKKMALRTKGFLHQGKIYINQDKAEAGTVIHESLHFFQDISYYKLGINSNEGTTEYFTRLVCGKHEITRSKKYQKQYECIENLVRICGKDKLAQAYFQGDIFALEMTVDATKGQGTYQQWISLMNQSDFEKANKLL